MARRQLEPGQGLTLPMANRLPTGAGSRGGRWHEREYRNAYQRAWRAAHPAYREREALRRARAKAPGTELLVPPAFPRSLPLAAHACACGCGCVVEILAACWFCRDGFHNEPP